MKINKFTLYFAKIGKKVAMFSKQHIDRFTCKSYFIFKIETFLLDSLAQNSKTIDLLYLLNPPPPLIGESGSKTRIDPPYPHARRKRQLKWCGFLE